MNRFYKYPEPNPRDYETEEDYQEALDEFYAAMDYHAECYRERKMENRQLPTSYILFLVG